VTSAMKWSNIRQSALSPRREPFEVGQDIVFPQRSSGTPAALIHQQTKRGWPTASGRCDACFSPPDRRPGIRSRQRRRFGRQIGRCRQGCRGVFPEPGANQRPKQQVLHDGKCGKIRPSWTTYFRDRRIWVGTRRWGRAGIEQEQKPSMGTRAPGRRTEQTTAIALTTEGLAGAPSGRTARSGRARRESGCRARNGEPVLRYRLRALASVAAQGRPAPAPMTEKS